MKEKAEIQETTLQFANRFIQRWDMYPIQLPEGHYVSIKEPLGMAHVQSHLKGDITLGIYLLTRESKARFAVLDADDEEHFKKLTSAAGWLDTEGMPTYLENSRRGGHLWFFFDDYVPGCEARSFLQGVVQRHKLGEIEIYPKQDELKDGPGSLIRLPFGIHRKTGMRYGFVNPDLSPLKPTLRQQFMELLNPKTIDTSRIGEYKVEQPIHDRRIRTGFENIRSIQLSDFIGQYMELAPTSSGFVGKCPFHDDQHRSFGINVKGNYWHCFAGCGGGDIISFWMKRKGIGFPQAVKELEEILGVAK